MGQSQSTMPTSTSTTTTQADTKDMHSAPLKDFKTEFAVEMTCQSCVDSISDILKKFPGINHFDIDLKEQRVTVEGHAPPSRVSKALKESGRTVIIRGQGVSGGKGHSGAAVCIFDTFGSDPTATIPTGTQGLARFVQIDNETCLIDLTVQGLTPGKHGVHIHELGDISRGWMSAGDHFNPTGVDHGDQYTGHVGDLGNVEVDENGWGDLVIESERVKVWDIIGRSMVISKNEDDLGRADTKASKWDGSSGEGVLCGIIARSAGAFENMKKVCACSGKTLWEEARLEQNKKVE
ncbi:superoxide dismutase [Radiomyces spectabilis]|uniref:superoxide dismutase n=1 Tax=Radiomyces spectabilis TaxID=64574 RepID=UPI00221FAFE9|nr:superoxide dismutase [Radiomyces spectabilis]KAI8391318.1 superoxide dismutase [Radiomyces spectabilis]